MIHVDISYQEIIGLTMAIISLILDALVVGMLHERKKHNNKTLNHEV